MTKRKADESLAVSPLLFKKKRTTPKTAVDKELSRRISRIEKSIEVKYTDFWQGYVTIPVETTPAWQINCLNTSTLGAAQNANRIGTQIVNKEVKLRMSLLQHTANILDNRVRIVVFFYKNSNTLLPAIGQFFDLSSVFPTYAFKNEQYKDSFEILYDRTVELKPLDWNGTNTTIGDQVSINKTISLKNRKSRYVTGVGGGTYADLIDNGLFIAVMTSANSGAAGVNNPTIAISSRCFYVDA